MTQIKDKAFKEILQEAIEEDRDFTKELLKFMLQQTLEYERDKQIGVDKYERDDNERKGSRNGHKEKLIGVKSKHWTSSSQFSLPLYLHLFVNC